jgi:hypothetical protein
MSLALLIYLLDSLERFHDMMHDISSIVILWIIFLCGYWIYNAVEATDSYNKEEVINRHKAKIEWCKKKIFGSLLILLAMIFMVFLVPSKKTGYMMAGAYIVQSLSDTELAHRIYDESGNISGKVIQIVNKELDKYLEEPKEEKK